MPSRPGHECLPQMHFGKAERTKRKSTARKVTTAAKRGPVDGPVRLQLDARTIITCKPSAVAFWQRRYPNLSIL